MFITEFAMFFHCVYICKLILTWTIFGHVTSTVYTQLLTTLTRDLPKPFPLQKVQVLAYVLV